MSLRILVLALSVAGLAALVALQSAATSSAQRPATTPTVAPPFSGVPTPPTMPTPAPTFGPFVAVTPLPLTPTAGPLRVTPLAQRSAPLTDADILADVQQRILAKLPQTAEAVSARATLQPYTASVRRYAPGQLAALSPDLRTTPLDPSAMHAVVVVPCACDGSLLPQGPKHPIDYVVLVYDPRYSAPVRTLWAPETDLVQAITGNRTKPTATVAPTANPTQAAARATAAVTTSNTDGQPGLQAVR